MPMQRQLRRLSVVAALLALPACYEYVPTNTQPTVGEIMAYQITDKGRVELADKFGPGLLRVEGRLMADSAEQYVISVFGVTQIDGTSTTWSGERIRIPHEYVGHVEGRELSKGRTVVAALAATGAVVAFIATHGMGISGTSSPPGTPGPGQASILIPTIR